MIETSGLVILYVLATRRDANGSAAKHTARGRPVGVDARLTIGLAVLALLVAAAGIGWMLAWSTNSSTATEAGEFVVPENARQSVGRSNPTPTTRRAEAVRDFWLANGGNAEQIILDRRGEEGADADADEEEAQLDRRVELVVTGFLPG